MTATAPIVTGMWITSPPAAFAASTSFAFIGASEQPKSSVLAR